jgi:hypothetical protein
MFWRDDKSKELAMRLGAPGNQPWFDRVQPGQVPPQAELLVQVDP